MTGAGNGSVNIDSTLIGYGLFGGTVDNITYLSVDLINKSVLWPSELIMHRQS